MCAYIAADYASAIHRLRRNSVLPRPCASEHTRHSTRCLRIYVCVFTYHSVYYVQCAAFTSAMRLEASSRGKTRRRGCRRAGILHVSIYIYIYTVNLVASRTLRERKRIELRGRSALCRIVRRSIRSSWLSAGRILYVHAAVV